MAKKANQNGIKVNAAKLNTVAKGVAKEITTAGRDAKKERKTLKQLFAFS